MPKILKLQSIYSKERKRLLKSNARIWTALRCFNRWFNKNAFHKFSNSKEWLVKARKPLQHLIDEKVFVLRSRKLANCRIIKVEKCFFSTHLTKAELRRKLVGLHIKKWLTVRLFQLFLFSFSIFNYGALCQFLKKSTQEVLRFDWQADKRNNGD